MVARKASGSAEGLTLAVKGGHNGENHNHLDLGSMVTAVDGVPLLVDAGQPTYTAQTFGPDRYLIRAMQSEWHSTPAPWGLRQGVGRDFAVDVVREPTVDDPTMVMQLERAYDLPAGSSWRRTAALERGRTERVRIADEWVLPGRPEGAGSGVEIHYLLAGCLAVQKPGMASVLPEGIPGVTGGRGAVLHWDASVAAFDVQHWQLDDPLLSGVWGERLTRLTFRVTPEHRATGSFTLEVKVNDE
jgi:hypothetical protein